MDFAHMAGALLAADRYRRRVPGLAYDVLGRRMAEAEWDSIPVVPEAARAPSFDLVEFLADMVGDEKDATQQGEAAVLLAMRRGAGPPEWLAGLAASLLVYSELCALPGAIRDPVSVLPEPAQFVTSPLFDALVERAMALDDRALYDQLQLWAEGRRFTVTVGEVSMRGGTVP